MHQSCADTLVTEEPDERIAHVRLCGGGWLGNHWPYPEEKRQAMRLRLHLVFIIPDFVGKAGENEPPQIENK